MIKLRSTVSSAPAVLSVLFVVMLFIPFIERFTRIVPSESLYNVAKEGGLKRPTRLTITSGKYQNHFEKWFLHNCGLWEILVKIQNTLNYHIFQIVSSRYGGETLMGAGHALHDRVYLMDRNGLPYGRDKKILTLDPDVQAQQLKKLQDYFEAQGKTFLVVIHPTKPLVHPEWVSGDEKLSEVRERYFPKLEKQIKARGVNYFHLMVSENEKEFPIFSKSGAHMTSYGKCLSAKGIVDFVSQRNGSMSRIDCKLDGKLVPPYGEDLDLLRLLNAWKTEQSISLVPSFTLEKAEPLKHSQARLLALGTSYVFGLIKAFEQAHTFGTTDFIFYKKSRYYGKNLGTSEEKKGAKKYLTSHHDISFALEHDVIMLEATEARAHQLGFGFVEDVISQIDKGIVQLPVAKKKK